MWLVWYLFFCLHPLFFRIISSHHIICLLFIYYHATLIILTTKFPQRVTYSLWSLSSAIISWSSANTRANSLFLSRPKWDTAYISSYFLVHYLRTAFKYIFNKVGGKQHPWLRHLNTLNFLDVRQHSYSIVSICTKQITLFLSFIICLFFYQLQILT